MVRPEGWETSLKVGSNRANSVNLAPGEKVSISAEIALPEDFSSQVVSIIAEGGVGGAEEKARYDVPVVRGKSSLPPRLSSSMLEVFSNAGEEVKLSLKLENRGYEEKLFNLSASLPGGWNASFYYSGLETNLVKVAGRSTASVEARLEIPEYALPGGHAVNFEAASQGTSANYTARVIVERSPPSSRLRTSTPVVIAKPGDEIRLSLELENKAREEDHYLLHSAVPRDWAVEFYHKGFKVPSLKLDPESSVPLEARVKIPEAAPLGDYQLSFIARGDNSIAERNVTLQLEGSYSFDVELSKLYMRIAAGEREEITARVANTGKNLLSGIELSMEVPESWSYEIEPEKIERLEPGKAEDFSVVILPPSGTEMGDHFLKLKVSPEEAEPEEVSLRVTVHQKSSHGIAGLVVAILSGLALLGVYRKFGRR